MKPKKKLIYFVLPFCAGIALILSLLIYNANKILKYELVKFLGKSFAVENIELGWGSAQAEKIRLMRPDGKQALNVDKLAVKADFIGLLKKENSISRLELNSPYILLETNKKGEIIFPLPGEESKKEKAGPSVRGFLIKKVEISKGSLDYVDRKVVGPPAFIRLKDIQLGMKGLSVPAENIVSDYELSASLPGKMGNGSLKSTGSINLKTRDTKAKLNIKHLDITLLKPYYQKKGDVDVTKGLLSVDSDISIVNSKIHSTGRLVIKDLEFVSGKGTFLGLPLIAVTKMMKDSNNEIVLGFTLEGDLKNPKFNIRDSLAQKIALSFAKTLGLPIEKIGKSVFEFGGEALKNIFK